MKRLIATLILLAGFPLWADGVSEKTLTYPDDNEVGTCEDFRKTLRDLRAQGVAAELVDCHIEARGPFRRDPVTVTVLGETYSDCNPEYVKVLRVSGNLPESVVRDLAEALSLQYLTVIHEAKGGTWYRTGHLLGKPHCP